MVPPPRGGAADGRGMEVPVFFLLLLGFAVKTPVFPLHTWLPVVAQEGPVAVVALLTGLKLGAYGLIRAHLLAWQVSPAMFRPIATSSTSEVVQHRIPINGSYPGRHLSPSRLGGAHNDPQVFFRGNEKMKLFKGQLQELDEHQPPKSLYPIKIFLN